MVDVKKAMAKQAVANAMGKVGLGKGTSNDEFNYETAVLQWREYNYPPVLKLFHYSTDKLKAEFRAQSIRMHIAALLILVQSILQSKFST